MIRFIKVVGAVDKITDCVPVVSSIKNVGILLYQLVHKVNKAAAPITPSWTDDIKIHMLSKDAFLAGVAMIPFIGNWACLIYQLKNTIDKGGFLYFGPLGYLSEATRKWNWGLKTHSLEVATLYLARNPNRSEEKLVKALKFAGIAKNKEIFQLILNSRTDWSSASIESVLMSASNTEIVALVLEKYKFSITNEKAAHILYYYTNAFFNNNSERLSLIQLLLDTYQEIDINWVGRSLEGAVNNADCDVVDLLLTRFPNIKIEYLVDALKKASTKGYTNIIELFRKKSPELVVNHLNQLLKDTANRGDIETLNWLLLTYKENITTAHIGEILESATQSFYFGENDPHLLIINAMIDKYPNLSGKDLEPALERSAMLNVNLFDHYLTTFSKLNPENSQLKPENLQDLLNHAVFIYRDIRDYAKVAQLIQKTFPNMVAVEP